MEENRDNGPADGADEAIRASVLDAKPANIRREWHWVRPILEELLADNPDVDEIPEDVYSDCMSGKSCLWVSPDYMMITEFDVDERSGSRELFIAYAKAFKRGEKIGHAIWNLLERVAAANQCSAVAFGTRYQKLIDYLCSDLGFRVSTQILRKDIGGKP